MIRVLVMIAGAGFVVSLVTLSIAVGIAGPDAIAHGAWSWTSNGWGFHHHREDWRSDDGGPQTTRDIAWTGSDALVIDLPADVQYTQAAGAPKITVTGPKDAVADVEVENDRIQYASDHDDDARLTIVISAPAVTRFTMQSSGKLSITDYRQDKLGLELEGDADVKAAGEAKTIDLSISGSADADLGALQAAAAKVEIGGSGDATLAPTDSADIDIEGSGDVTLLTHPGKLQTRLSGSGQVRQREPGASSGRP